MSPKYLCEELYKIEEKLNLFEVKIQDVFFLENYPVQSFHNHYK
jgi:hypothetical protein